MQPKSVQCVAKKEIALFFSSPIAYLFLAVFSAVSLFIFFWGESFFSRNISDVRPLFEWMPVLLVFLCSTLTMRMWSEERRSGTLEHVLTQCVPIWKFVLGKFVACCALLVIALFITLPLPITVAVIGDLDWGPVFAAYIAALLLGAAYISIGLFVSARSDNQIVSLISACVLSGCLYLIGTDTITGLFGNQMGEWLRSLGTGSRFESITRGVIDISDLYYYISIVIVFLALNTFILEKVRWVDNKNRRHHRYWQGLTFLFVINACVANVWLSATNTFRFDVTQGKQYSISSATKNYLAQTQEPLLLRGYFSEKTHPLLAPLIPQLRDLLKEYSASSDKRVRVEFVDPPSQPELEEEANQKYGIRPVPFQVADRYQSAIVSSYFNILVSYGDEYQVLGFRELIEVKSHGGSDIDVRLRNPEHDVTRAIKRVLQSYQSSGNVFDTVREKLDFTLYASSDDALPKKLVEYKNDILTVLEELESKSSGRFGVNIIDPDANGGEVGKRIAEEYGFNPMATNLFSADRFYFYPVLAQGDQLVQIPLGDMSAESFERDLDAGIKRFAAGFTKTVSLVLPAAPDQLPPQMQRGRPLGPQFNQLEQFLSEEFNVKREDIGDGVVSGDTDILIVIAPESLNEKALFAIDQFLMKGGTVVMSTSPYQVDFGNRRLNLSGHTSGLTEWLSHNGIEIDEKLVLDKQNSAFAVPVTRNVGGFQVQEMRMLDYPFFVDVRGKGLNNDNMITSELPNLSMTWASPIQIDEEKNKGRSVQALLRSSDKAWLSSTTDIMPRLSDQGVTGFQQVGESGSHVLGLVNEGVFTSYFSGKSSPLLEKTETEGDDSSAVDADSEPASTEDASAKEDVVVTSVIERSPKSARIIAFSSNDFLRDQVLGILSGSRQTEYLSSMQLLTNAIDWALEDEGLLSIRARGHFNRTLPPLEKGQKLFWEYMNYALAIFALLLVAIAERVYRIKKQRSYLAALA